MRFRRDVHRIEKKSGLTIPVKVGVTVAAEALIQNGIVKQLKLEENQDLSINITIEARKQ